MVEQTYKPIKIMTPINISVTWKYTSPRQYKERDYTFKNQERYDTWFDKMISNEKIRKIIKLEIL